MLCPLRVLLSAAAPGRHVLVRSRPVTLSPLRYLHGSCRCKQEFPQEAIPLEDDPDKAFTAQLGDIILRQLNTVPQSQAEWLQGAACIMEQHDPLWHDQDLQPPSMQEASVLNFTAHTTRQTIARFIKPDAPLHRLRAAESVVSIVFGLKKLAWVHMERSMRVRDWQLHDCFRTMKGRHQPEAYLEDISSVVAGLPQADLYILEKSGISSQNSSLFPVALHLRTVEMMLYCLLNPRFQAEREHQVFSMSRNTVGKHFQIMVGDSRTSGVEIVKRLVEEAVIVPKPRVTFTPELILAYRQHFETRGQNRNEEICDALLQAVTFYELALP